jgi:hypothetical protein
VSPTKVLEIPTGEERREGWRSCAAPLSADSTTAVSASELHRLLALWTDNLRVGSGEVGTDSVLLRSFSALNLSLLAARDSRRSFLDEDECATFLSTILTYFRDERDLRGFDDE